MRVCNAYVTHHPERGACRRQLSLGLCAFAGVQALCSCWCEYCIRCITLFSMHLGFPHLGVEARALQCSPCGCDVEHVGGGDLARGARARGARDCVGARGRGRARSAAGGLHRGVAHMRLGQCPTPAMRRRSEIE